MRKEREPAGKGFDKKAVLFESVWDVWTGKAANHVFGLDGPTGKVLWRCTGRSLPVDLLDVADPEGLPAVVFQLRKPDVAVAPRAMRRTADGSYTGQGWLSIPEEGDVPMVVPLPWAAPTREDLRTSMWASFVAAGLLGWCVFRRCWGRAVVLLLCLLVGRER